MLESEQPILHRQDSTFDSPPLIFHHWFSTFDYPPLILHHRFSTTKVPSLILHYRFSTTDSSPLLCCYIYSIQAAMTCSSTHLIFLCSAEYKSPFWNLKGNAKHLHATICFSLRSIPTCSWKQMLQFELKSLNAQTGQASMLKHLFTHNG